MSLETRIRKQWEMDLLGPEALAALRTPLTPQQSALLDQRLAEYDGDPVAAIHGEHLPADVQATIRRVMSEAVR